MIMRTKREEESVDDFISKMEDKLNIDHDALEECLQMQPEHLYEVSKKWTLYISRRDQAKQNLTLLESQIGIEIRSTLRKEDKKTTEKEIETLLISDEAIVEANRDLLKLSAAIGQLNALKEAFINRGYVLKDMVSLYLHNYFGDPSNAPQSRVPSHIRERQTEEAKTAMHRERLKR